MTRKTLSGLGLLIMCAGAFLLMATFLVALFPEGARAFPTLQSFQTWQNILLGVVVAISLLGFVFVVCGTREVSAPEEKGPYTEEPYTEEDIFTAVRRINTEWEEVQQLKQADPSLRSPANDW